MENRLHLFDDIFTEILLGFALALLIGIAFAPQLVGVSGELPSKSADSKVIQQEQLLDDGAQRENPSTEQSAGIHYWWKSGQHSVWVLWILICLFCFKVVHEQSVMRYHLNRVVPFQVNEPGWLANISQFVSKIALLLTLYILIILIYLSGYGKATDSLAVIVFAILLLASYLLPNCTLYHQLISLKVLPSTDLPDNKEADPGNTMRERDKTIRENTCCELRKTVAKWLALDVFNVFGIAVIFFVSPISKAIAGVVALIAFMCVVAVFIGLTLVEKERVSSVNGLRHDIVAGCYAWTEDFKKFPWLLGSLIIILAATVILPVVGYDVPFSPHDGIIIVLTLNIMDWGLNYRFYFVDLRTYDENRVILVQNTPKRA
ncbi:MAG: hypothetical protein MN733_33030 [Nitrososphaera sp.]|nr:hypothetical protein [Nitrososphaera sp.]